jgi:hypothetical protein
MEKCGALAWCTNKKWQADFLLFCTECRGNSVRTGEEDWVNAQKQAVKTVKNADFCSKRHGRSTFLDEIGTRAGKRRGAGCGPGAVGKCTGKHNFSGGKKSF